VSLPPDCIIRGVVAAPAEIEIVRSAFDDSNFPWYLNRGVAFNESDAKDCSFAHKVFVNGQPNSALWPAMAVVASSLGCNIKHLVRIQCNLYVRSPVQIAHPWHIDTQLHAPDATTAQLGTTVVWYWNTNNGATELLQHGKVIRVPSVANTALIMPNSQIHRSVTCTDSACRITTVMNFLEPT
jgi:hypothetical protein